MPHDTPALLLSQAQAWIPGARLVGVGETAIKRVHSDTRTLQGGDLFVALRGENFDANDFLAEAKARGAAAAIAERGLAAAGLSGLEVPDSRLALGQLAAGWRAQFQLPLVAVTGSNGKTTVTQMIASILRAYCSEGAGGAEAAFATQGNLNNDIGVPLTLMRLRARHRVGVVELGMNHPGEIDYLARIARPTVALVNNAQREHMEFMATIEAVARENGSVLASLPPTGVAVLPAEDEFAPLWAALAGPRPCLFFGVGDSAHADVRLAGSAWLEGSWQVSVQTPAGPVDYRLHIAGRHNVRNSLAAVACALAAGVPLAAIAQGLEAFVPVAGRSRALALQLGDGESAHRLTLVDDAYNANPDSVHAAIDVLAELPGPRLLVLGDMGEVGDQGPKFHREAGAYARERGIEQLFAHGAQCTLAAAAFGAPARHFETMEALNAAVLAALPQTASVLVKGSKFMKMPRVVEAIAGHARPKEESSHAA